MNKRLALTRVGALAGCGGSKPATTSPAPAHEETTTPTEVTGTATPAVTPVQAAPNAEIGKWGFDLNGMDASVAPGDSFYNHANGAWAKATPIPPDKPNYGMFTVLADKSDERTKEIILAAAGPAGS